MSELDVSVLQGAASGHCSVQAGDVIGSTIALLQKVESALSEVTIAERALESALRELRTGPRAEKITVSAAVEDAFARVRAARAELASLRGQLESDSNSTL